MTYQGSFTTPQDIYVYQEPQPQQPIQKPYNPHPGVSLIFLVINIFFLCFSLRLFLQKLIQYKYIHFYNFIQVDFDPLQQPPMQQTSMFEDEDGNLGGDADNRLTLFIASSSIIILSLITIIGVVSCFILCHNEPVSFYLISILVTMQSMPLLFCDNRCFQYLTHIHNTHGITMPSGAV